MRIGKVKESILKRSVLKQLHNRSETGSPAYGEDAGTFRMSPILEDLQDDGKEISESPAGDLAEPSINFRTALQMNPVEGWTLAPQRAVYGAINAFAAAGADLHAIAVTILMPEGTQESRLKAFMKELNQLCEQEKIHILAGHTAVSPAVHTLVVAVAAVGVETLRPDLQKTGGQKAAMMVSELEKKGWKNKGITAGNANNYTNQDLVMAGTSGREGTALLAVLKEEELQSRYAASYIDTAKHFYDNAGMKDAAEILRVAGAVRLHDVREGGVFGGLWELAAACKVGLDIDLATIPIRQHTIEVCEFFDLNPYMLLSGGCLLAICPDGRKAAKELKHQGIEAAVIGRTTDSNDRIIRYDTETRYLEPPKADEIYKIKDIFN